MALLDAMKQLDDRVLGAPQDDAARGRRALPWILAVVLVVELLSRLTDLDAAHGAVPWLLAGALFTALQSRRG